LDCWELIPYVVRVVMITFKETKTWTSCMVRMAMTYFKGEQPQIRYMEAWEMTYFQVAWETTFL
jgi:hypothetical protein